MVAIGRFMEELSHGTGMIARQFGIGFERQPRPQHERPLPCTGVRQRQVRIVAALTVKIDDVQIKCARSPMVGTHSTMFGFDALQSSQQFHCRQFGGHGNNRIVKVGGTIGHAPRIGTVQRRNARNLSGRQSVDRTHRVTQGGHYIALIATHGNDGMMHLRCSRSCFTRTFHGYAHVVEWHYDWRTRLMHGHLRSRHGRIFENHAGNAIGQFFDEIDMIAFDNGDYSFGDGTVIDGVVQIVGMPGWRKIQKQRGVDDERLRTLMFEIKYTVFADRANASQSNLIHASLSLHISRF